MKNPLKLFLAVTAISAVALFGCTPSIPSPTGPMKLSTTAFENNANIPSEFTCDGKNSSPEFQISNIPSATKSLALIMHDPDAPMDGGFTHWVMWNISPQTTTIMKNKTPAGALVGYNSTGKGQWTGPCPPSGTHHYQFMLFALDKELALPANTNKSDLEKAIAGHILEQTTLVGLYASKK